MRIKIPAALLLILAFTTLLWAEQVVEGYLLTNSIKNPKMKITSYGVRPKVGQKGTLQKYFQRTIMSGWLSKGTIQVTAIKGNTLSFKVLEESGIITINGQKVNHFTKNTKVKLFWGPKTSETTHSSVKVSNSTQSSAKSSKVSSYTPNPKSKYISNNPNKTASQKLSYQNFSSAITATDAPKTNSRFKPVWVSETDKWNGDNAVSNSGWALSFGSYKVFFHDAKTGEVKHTEKFAYVMDGGVKLLNDNRALIVGHDFDRVEIWELSLPGFEKRQLASAPNIDPDVASFGKNTVAVGGGNKRVLIYSLKDYSVLNNFTLDAEISGLAMSPNDSILAIGTDSCDLYIYNRSTEKMTHIHKGINVDVDAMSFSPDGSKLFAAVGGFKARVFDIATGNVISTLKTGSWLIESHWLSQHDVVATGSSGLVIYNTKTNAANYLKGPNGKKFDSTVEGLAVSPDYKQIVAGCRGGRIMRFEQVK